MDGNEPLRDLIYPGLARNPLLRFRLYSMKEAFSKADAVQNALAEHSQRVEWHIRRIYRSRNLLVHSGQGIPYRTALVENVHSYFHQVLNTLEGILSTTPPPPSLDAAFLHARLTHEQHVQILKDRKSEACTPENLLLLLTGHSSPRPN